MRPLARHFAEALQTLDAPQGRAEGFQLIVSQPTMEAFGENLVEALDGRSVSVIEWPPVSVSQEGAGGALVGAVIGAAGGPGGAIAGAIIGAALGELAAMGVVKLLSKETQISIEIRKLKSEIAEREEDLDVYKHALTKAQAEKSEKEIADWKDEIRDGETRVHDLKKALEENEKARTKIRQAERQARAEGSKKVSQESQQIDQHEMSEDLSQQYKDLLDLLNPKEPEHNVQVFLLDESGMVAGHAGSPSALQALVKCSMNGSTKVVAAMSKSWKPPSTIALEGIALMEQQAHASVIRNYLKTNNIPTCESFEELRDTLATL